ncbi:HEAT repeat domain-containing protein [Candidatus Uabimicrobium sp. HlEnr_7]|uniref:HEAT repeat domain-containing protein n=1 Tax=Candidatus Uabimicrobium helgolandensis TaxID=3095367 RepID=UPI00355861E1
MEKEFRVECKFCLKAIMAPPSLGGKKVRCPSCKNPILVPNNQSGNQPISPSPDNEKKDIKNRAIASRHQKGQITRIIKYIAILVLAYFAYTTYVDLNNKNDKTIETLFEEYSKKEDSTTSFFIKKKVTSADLETLKEYSKASEEHVQIVVAECLPKMQYSEYIHELLTTYLQDGSNKIKMAAAESCGYIEQIPIVELLITQLEKEEDKSVRGSIGSALRNLTGVRGNTVNSQRWRVWWQEKKRNYRFPKIK